MSRLIRRREFRAGSLPESCQSNLLKEVKDTNTDDGLFAFDAENKLLLFDLHVEILSFQVSWHFNSNIKISDRLDPFVR